MRHTGFIALVGTITLLVGTAYAADNKEKSQAQDGVQSNSFSRSPLEGILDAVSRKSGKTFLVDARVSPSVVVGQPRAKDITFSMLLKVLRNNGLAAVIADDTVSIIPVATIRQHPLPLLFEDNEAIDEEEWVTRVIRLQNASAKHVVPILRPLLPQQGHLAAHVDSNTLILVDRYANARRVSKMILAMDASAQNKDE